MQRTLRSGILKALLVALFFQLSTPALSQQTVEHADHALINSAPAVDGILAAFETRPLVGLADEHGLVEEMDLYAELVRDPRFSEQVGNLDVEFGSATHQDIVDRYIAGEDIAYTDLRHVWTDTVGWFPRDGFYIGFARFLAAVRKANENLPDERRIKVWMAGPPLNATGTSETAFSDAMGQRDQYPAELITQEILEKNRKALIIFGAAHFSNAPFLLGLVEQDHPDSFWVVLPLAGTIGSSECRELLDGIESEPSSPLLITAKGGDAGTSALRPCTDPGRSAAGVRMIRRDQIEAALADNPGLRRMLESSARAGRAPALSGPTHASSNGVSLPIAPPIPQVDALLYLGPPEDLTKIPGIPDYFLDPDYRQMIQDRSQEGWPPAFPFREDLALRKSDYDADLAAQGYRQSLDAMFDRFDLNRDGTVTHDEYVDPLSR